jgi:predicted DNA-binding ribbon-helix-helix protein
MIGLNVISTAISAFRNSLARKTWLMTTHNLGVADSDTRISKRSLVVSGHRTSISLENIFWEALKREATARNLSIARLVGAIDAVRGEANLSSAIRVHLFRASAKYFELTAAVPAPATSMDAG